MMPMRRKSPLVCQLSKLLPAFCLFGFSLLLLAQGEWTSPNRIGLVQDWSTHHAVFPRNGPLSAMLAAQHDPRAFYSWRVAALDAVRTTSTSAAQTETAVDERHRANLRMSNRDWSIRLGSAGTAGAMYPAKLTFDINGTKVAFVESKSGSQPHFHVLAWKNWDGVNASNKQDAQSPKVLSTFTASAPVAGSGTATDLAFGVSGAGSGDTLSSPFVDYGTDKAYIGDDKGHLVRLKDVFCTINVACTGAAPPAPSIDTIWGTTGTVTVACGSKLTGPVVDFFTGNVFVGCSDGKLYGFNSSGTSLANSPVTVGNGAAT